MTDAKNTTDQEVRKAAALYRWASALAEANEEYYDVTGGMPQGEAEIASLTVVNAVAQLTFMACADEPYGAGSAVTSTGRRVAKVREFARWNGRDLQILRRLRAGLRPAIDARSSGKAVELSVAIIDLHAENYATVELEPRDRSRVAMHLALVLGARVHSAFLGLLSRLEEVGALLARRVVTVPRAKNGKPGHRAKSGEASPLTSAGILVNLNAAVKCPLGKLSPDGVEKAVKRERYRE